MLSNVCWRIIIFLAQRKIMRVDGVDHLPSGGMVLAATHGSWVDSGVIAAALNGYINHPAVFLTTTPTYRWSGLTVVARKEFSLRAMREALRHLREGRALCVFPAGDWRHPTPPLRTAAWCAQHANVSLIQVTIQNVVPGHGLSGLLRFLRQPRNVIVRFSLG